jgi:SPX domain protein involved in polyphosphate accumulation
VPEYRPEKNADTIRSFNRFELKYLVTAENARTIERDLALHLLPDSHGDGAGDYRIASLYFDSPDRRCYWEKVEGIRFRRKLRLRRYVQEENFGDESSVFVEIKQRVDRVTQKRRLVLPYGTARSLIAGGDSEPLTLAAPSGRHAHGKEGQESGITSSDETLMEEIVVFSQEYRLEPACVVSYRRRAFVGGKLDPGLRVTFDSDLRSRTADPDLGSASAGQAVLTPGAVVMEIKANDRVPRWLTELIAARNLRLVRISKYVACLDATTGPSPAWTLKAVSQGTEKR